MKQIPPLIHWVNGDLLWFRGRNSWWSKQWSNKWSKSRQKQIRNHKAREPLFWSFAFCVEYIDTIGRIWICVEGKHGKSSAVALQHHSTCSTFPWTKQSRRLLNLSCEISWNFFDMEVRIPQRMSWRTWVDSCDCYWPASTAPRRKQSVTTWLPTVQQQITWICFDFWWSHFCWLSNFDLKIASYLYCNDVFLSHTEVILTLSKWNPPLCRLIGSRSQALSSTRSTCWVALSFQSLKSLLWLGSCQGRSFVQLVLWSALTAHVFADEEDSKPVGCRDTRRNSTSGFEFCIVIAWFERGGLISCCLMNWQQIACKASFKVCVCVCVCVCFVHLSCHVRSAKR